MTNKRSLDLDLKFTELHRILAYRYHFRLATFQELVLCEPIQEIYL